MACGSKEESNSRQEENEDNHPKEDKEKRPYYSRQQDWGDDFETSIAVQLERIFTW